MTDNLTFLDGNAAAGELRQIFAVDLTVAISTCAGCGRSEELATARVYRDAPGLVLRCPGCDGVLLRVVTAPGRTWLDMQGISVLRLTSTT